MKVMTGCNLKKCLFVGSDPGRRYNYPRLRDRDGNNFYLPSSDTDHFKISLVKTNATGIYLFINSRTAIAGAIIGLLLVFLNSMN